LRAAVLLALLATCGAAAPLEVLARRPLRTRSLRGCDCQELTYRIPGSPPVKGFWLRPRDQVGPRPLLVFHRGGMGPSEALRPPQLGWLCGLVRRGGYVALAPQYRGAAGGQGTDELGGRDLDDSLALARWGRSQEGVQDLPPYMLGVSRGGGMTYMAIARGLRLAAAAVVGAPTALESLHRGFGPMRRRRMERVLGGTPEEVPGAYRLRSAAAWPERLRVPLLVLHGGRDPIIPAAQVAGLVDELAARRLPHRFALFPRGDHLLISRARQRDEAILDWFATHPPRPEPAWLTQEEAGPGGAPRR
jgi:dipeptidyl aminopeptidase/acylaminoacyl peptidase